MTGHCSQSTMSVCILCFYCRLTQSSTRSAVLKASCDGNFLEAKTGCINVEAYCASVATIERMLDYLYLHDYDDAHKHANYSNDGGDESDKSPERLHTEKLIIHVHMYAIADYYQIYDLKECALSKFTKQLDEDNMMLQQVVIEVS